MITYVYPSIIFISIFFILLIALIFKGIQFNFLQYFALFSFTVYIIIVISLVFFPFPTQNELIRDSINNGWGVTNNFIPFTSISSSFSDGTALLQVFGNILLFSPFGFYMPTLFSKYDSFKNIILTGFIVSGFIELLQEILNFYLGYNYRSCDVDDIILNTFGAIVGYFIYLCSKPSINRILNSLKLQLRIR